MKFFSDRSAASTGVPSPGAGARLQPERSGPGPGAACSTARTPLLTLHARRGFVGWRPFCPHFVNRSAQAFQKFLPATSPSSLFELNDTMTVFDSCGACVPHDQLGCWTLTATSESHTASP